MSVIPAKVVDYGVGFDQVHLGVVPDSEDSALTVLTDTAQTITGIKEFKSVMKSPASPASVAEVSDGDETVTHGQLKGYAEDIKKKYATEIITGLSGEEIKLLEDSKYKVYDPVTGQYLGDIRTGPVGSTPTFTPPASSGGGSGGGGGSSKPPAITPLPDNTITIPGKKIVIVPGKGYVRL